VVEPGGIIQAPQRRTPTYTKPMLGKDELNRLDIKNRTPTPEAIQEHVIELLDEAWPQLDALLVLDQVSEAECGVVTKRVRDHLAELGAREPEKFVLADSREQIGLFRNVCIKPNQRELETIFSLGKDFKESVDLLQNGLEDIGRNAFVTEGENGISLYKLESASVVAVSVPAYRVSGPIDICGAGDSCSAGIACAMVSGATHEQAAAFGNLVASITIQQIGVTGTATPEQVRARWSAVSPPA
jgi:bifunctional ADP-heptose synthase (sugar kinase/adenylyltransferase)